jgi:non-lysosomal glucosylceramidase
MLPRDVIVQTISGFGGNVKRLSTSMLAFSLCFSAASGGWADGIPKAAWKRPLGLPLDSPGVTRVHGDIDDGYWQGVPVGGLGAGTFSRSYRGDFSRWHIKAAIHK